VDLRFYAKVEIKSEKGKENLEETKRFSVVDYLPKK